ncbi:MAG: toxin-antitoxin system HicB family antitoxin [Acidobacteria bacterium]|nr:toxin-antitoxin system HicB family antitoxin [Acidobacteriota bacterium]
MTSRESFLLRTDPRVLEALRRWSRDELRSVNGQIEYILRRALAETGRFPGKRPAGLEKSTEGSS